jgi:hypothetical protein
MHEPKLHSQIDRVRAERKSRLEHRDGFVELSNFGELTGILEKRRRKRRPPRCGLAQLVKRLAGPPEGGQCLSKQIAGSSLRRAALSKVTIASAGRFCISSARASRSAARTLPRFAFNTPEARRSASLGRCIRNAKTAPSSVWSLEVGRSRAEGLGGRFDIGLNNKP